ncbi:alpha/beta hydrolase [Brevundimonas sp.]|jgi:pimeloyl-ACP methyl ester carboxylesterase|uniref:alpha/beta hydrolase n=1 Tax=Brevundimonas sp. TaxID=1871086 RepID=UPI0018321D3A|nr:alpha/beta hydrolase [Brevundimonas sp.]MBA4808897.1 alpha/beta fold hydrolase [Brevundimonas sp.]
MATRTADPVVFVHGLWVTAASWLPFSEPWLEAGYEVHTPEWPVIDGLSAAELRNDPPLALGSLSIEAVVDRMAAHIRTLDRPPLLVGHSFGGLFIQLLLDQGLGRAGIALNPAPIAGVVPGRLTLRAAAPAILRPRGWRRPYALSRRLWAERYANAAPPALQAETWGRYVVPTSGRIIHQAAFWRGTGVDPRRRRQPLLITAGDRDRLVTPYLSRAAFRLQRRSSAKTDFIDFPGRSHLLIAEPGWEEVAQACIAWDAPHRFLQSDADFLKAPEGDFL